jgi:prophage tail gpP-like protein
MHARFAIVAAAFFVAGSAFAAEPPKAPERESNAVDAHRPQIVLASADTASQASADQQAQPVQRRARVARVTTCRCGDQQAEPEE